MTDVEPAIRVDPDILGGKPVLIGTRVPFQALLDYLERDVLVGRERHQATPGRIGSKV
jgi:uncharacterized protein (DUF433 family)